MIVGDQNPGSHERVSGQSLGSMLPGCALLLLILFITFPSALAHAAEQRQVASTGPVQAEVLSRNFEYTIDPDWQLKVSDLVGASAVEMHPVAGPVPDFGYTSAKVWLRLRLVNETIDLSDWRFLVNIGFTQQIAIYRIGSGGEVATLLDLNEDSPFHARPINYPQIVAPFNLRPGEAATLVVAYHSMGASRHSMSIETPASFAEKSGIATAKNYALYGMMTVMIALATMALITLWQRVFAAYAAYLLSSLLYIANADGVAFQYIWPDFPQFNSMAASVTGSAVMVFSCLFAMSFLRTALYHPIMHRLLLAIIAAVLTLDVVLWATEPTLLNRLLVYMIVVSVLTCLIAGLVAARKRFKEVRFYVFAWAASLIPACLFTAHYAFGIETPLITLYDAIRLALVVDALMMGLAIFDRYNHLRQSAFKETLAYAELNLTLSQRLADLEESYQQVTTSARQSAESVHDTIHDLRQPMHTLRLSLRQMFSGGKQVAAEDIGQIETALGYMEKLVAERQAHSHEADKHGLDASVSATVGNDAIARPSNSAAEPGLHAVLRGVTDMFSADAATKGLGLKLVIGAPDGGVAAYPLMRALANLVSNAIKYSGHGRILITLRRSGTTYRIEVHDTGPGLSGAVFERALLRNERLDRDRFSAEGTGLGLAVVKDTTDANNWRLSSRASRRSGASICIYIPASEPPILPVIGGVDFLVSPVQDQRDVEAIA